MAQVSDNINSENVSAAFNEAAGKAREAVQGVVNETNKEKAKGLVRNLADRAKSVSNQLEGYAPVLVVAGGVVASAYFTRSNVKLTKELIDVSHAINSNVIGIFNELEIQASEAAYRQTTLMRDIDYYIKNGIDFVHYAGVGARPNDRTKIRPLDDITASLPDN